MDSYLIPFALEGITHISGRTKAALVVAIMAIPCALGGQLPAATPIADLINCHAVSGRTAPGSLTIYENLRNGSTVRSVVTKEVFAKDEHPDDGEGWSFTIISLDRSPVKSLEQCDEP